MNKIEDTMDLGITDQDIESIYAPYLLERFDLIDPRWMVEVATRQKSFRKLRWQRQFMRFLGRKVGQSKDGVLSGYKNTWNKEDYSDLLGKRYPCVWRNEGFISHSRGTLRVHQLHHFRAMAKLVPKRVLEVGCGASNHLFAMAARFPEVDFTGVELTPEGIETARRLQDDPTLPDIFGEFSPEPLQDVGAHKRVKLIQGDAENMEFEDGAFDYVYTSLALEQMESIRDSALREIIRVGSKWFVFCEPWRDCNESGVRRDYIVAKNYFAARVDDLRKYGLEPVFYSEDFPHKMNLGVGFVIAKKT